jgi:uncharacterized protein Smg (DUF494 family)
VLAIYPPGSMTSDRDDYDNPWKKVLEKYFQEFMQFFFPDIYDDIDWEKGYEFMDQEFQQIVRDAESTKMYVDKLVKVWRKSGEESVVFVHVEVQSQEESAFSQRVFTYNYRIRDCYSGKIVSLAVLGDDRSTWRPKPYEDELWGCKVRFEFPMVKLLDYESRWAELETSMNPFAIVVMAHLKTKSTKQDLRSRKEWKFQLTRRLFEAGFERQDIMELFLFLDWLMELPSELKREFKNEFSQYQEDKQMRYISTIEEIAVEDNQIDIAKNLLQEGVSIEIISRSTKLSIERVKELQQQINNVN